MSPKSSRKSGKSAKQRGDCGEALAARYLEARGYQILDRQWRCTFGELDLVARDTEGVICFVEVKFRKTFSHGLPREFVDARKQEKLRRAAMLWLSEYNQDVYTRFDVAEVYEVLVTAGENRETPRNQYKYQIKYLKDAFQ